MYQFELKPFRKSSWVSHSDWDKELERFFDSFGRADAFAPPCEITDEEKYYSISLDIPGLSKEDLEIEVKENHLHVSGERRLVKKTENDNVLRSEKRYGKFARAFTLPKNVDAEKIEAKFENGVLEIFLPKEEKAASKKIVISDWSRKESDTDVK